MEEEARSSGGGTRRAIVAVKGVCGLMLVLVPILSVLPVPGVVGDPNATSPCPFPLARLTSSTLAFPLKLPILSLSLSFSLSRSLPTTYPCLTLSKLGLPLPIPLSVGIGGGGAGGGSHPIEYIDPFESRDIFDASDARE